MHCGVKPFISGPHHKPGCPRNTTSMGAPVDDAYDHDCQYCSARPYTPGAHHLQNCPRYRH